MPNCLSTRYACALLVVACGCSGAQRVPIGVCGNHVLEANEDCDGATGCDRNCRYPCGEDVTCPPGLGCDTGLGFCRSGSGKFTPSAPLSARGGSPLARDFDGDGKDDLLLVAGETLNPSPSSVYYFERSTLAPTLLELPSAQAAACADVTADGRVDIVLGGGSVYAYEALPERGFSPIVTASGVVADGTKLYSVDLDCDGYREPLVLNGSTLSRVSSSGSLESPLELDVSAAHLAAPSAVGRLRQTGAPSCEALVLVEPANHRAWVYGKRVGGSSARPALLSTVDLAGLQSVSRVLLTDVDLDGLADLLVQEQYRPDQAPTLAYRQYVAHGEGDGSFAQLALFEDPEASGFVAAGQFDSDVALDYVAFSTPVEGGVHAAYSDAIAVDLTGDGREDVAAVLVDANDGFDVLRSHENGLFTRLAVTTGGPPTLRGVGDFDGDGQSDLLLTEGAQGIADQDFVTALFAPVTGSSARTRPLARIEHIEAAVPGYLTDDFGVTDGTSDVTVLRRGDAGALELALLEGGPERSLRSAIPGAEPTDSGALLTTRWPALGHFQSNAMPELAVISTSPVLDESTLEVFGLNAQGASSLGHARFGGGLTRATPVAVDLDLDGIDEIYALRDATRLIQVVVSLSSKQMSLRENGAWLDADVSSIAATDIDSDGHLDLSVQSGARIVVWIAGESSRAPHSFDFADHACASLFSHAWLNADSDPALELAVVCAPTDDPGASGKPPRTELRLFDAEFRTDSDRLTPKTSQPGPSSHALAVGDFNGDGVQDLAAGKGDVSVYWGTPTK